MSDKDPLTETTRRSEEIFKGKLLHVFRDEVSLPDGKSSAREWIRHPGACAIVPVFRDGTIMLVRQFRYPLKQTFFEVPAGKIDPGEPPYTTAVRELEEETGLQAGHCEKVGHFHPVIGYSDEIIHCFVAWDLDRHSMNSDSDEFLEPVQMPFSDATTMIRSGEITDGKTICSLMQTQMWWETNGPFEIAF
ncbi:MAG: NUDIX hydrolase [Balneolaceae bacterium]